MEKFLNVRSIEEIPLPYREIFSEFVHFNPVQSEVLDDIFHSDDSIVISSPTGSGKTTIFELAIVRLLMQYGSSNSEFKIIYICPMKSLCQERLVDWNKRFSGFGITSICITGDSDNFEFQNLIYHNLIISTPEKWDSLTRRWKEHEKLVKVIKLFMIDEVHLLNEEDRGATLEVIVPSTTEEWLQISFEFERKWQFPHVIGVMDGKHIILQAPINSGTEYYNYKIFFSIVLFAIVDADYNFIYADVGCQGRISDGGVFKNTALYNKLERRELNIPRPEVFQVPYYMQVPYYVLGDKVFALSEYTIKPFDGNPVVRSPERVFNYRHSRHVASWRMPLG